jgi:hypothetical protein
MNTINPLEPALMKLYRRAHVIAGLLSLLARQLDDVQKQLSRNIQNKTHDLPAAFMGMSLPIIDLTGKTDDGWLLHYASGGFSVADEEYVDALDAVVRRNAAWATSQMYEAFETFLKDILSLHFENRPVDADATVLAKFMAKHPPVSATMSPDEWRHFVQFAARGKSGKDNEGLFMMARQIAPSLERGETDNHLRVNLIDWYMGASKARHAVTHGDFEIKPGEWDALTERQMILCHTWFPCRVADGRRVLNLDKARAENAIKMFLQYAFTVFKFLSQTVGHDWDIFSRGFSTGVAKP